MDGVIQASGLNYKRPPGDTDNPEADDDRKLLEKLGLKTRSAMLESVQKESCGC